MVYFSSTAHTQIKSYFRGLKASKHDFEQLNINKKIVVIFATIVPQAAWIIGLSVPAPLTAIVGVLPSILVSLLVYRLMIKILKVPHPAEKPMGEDIISSIPQELILNIVMQCGWNTVIKVSETCKLFNTTSESFWECHSTKMLGKVPANLFKNARESWKNVILHIKSPVDYLTDSLEHRDHYSNESVKDYAKQPLIWRIFFCAGNNDTNALKDALEEALKEFNTYEMMNEYAKRIFDREPRSAAVYTLNSLIVHHCGRSLLAIVAAKGNLEKLRLLIDHGFRDFQPSFRLANGGVIPHEVIESSLFAAAKEKQVNAVKFLLGNQAGAVIYFLPEFFYKKLLKSYTQSDANFDRDKTCLECSFLLFKDSYQRGLAGDSSNLRCCCDAMWEAVLEYGAMNHAHLLIGLKVPNADNKFTPNYENLNLSIIKFCHESEIVNFIKWRGSKGETILHHCIALEAPEEVLNYLIILGVPEDAKNTQGETYKSSGNHDL